MINVELKQNLSIHLFLLVNCVYIEVMPGILSVALITELRAECAVEVNYKTSKKSSPDSEGKAFHFLTDYIQCSLDETHAWER